MAQRPLLDACLIVRDESADLPRALASLAALRPLLSRICVYDTGSMDDTVALAQAAGAQVELGYWDDDFSRARNASLDLSGAVWALTIDADEEAVVDLAALTELLAQDHDSDVLCLDQVHVDADGRELGRNPYLKILRTDTVRFTRTIHEIVMRPDGSECVIRQLPPAVAHLRHHGYATPAQRLAKGRRNAEAARQGLARARAADDVAGIAHAARHLGRSHDAAGEVDAAIAAYDEALNAWSPTSAAWRVTAVECLGALLAAGRFREGAALLGRARDSRPPAPEATVRDLAARLAAAHPEGLGEVLRLTDFLVTDEQVAGRDRDCDRALLQVRLDAAVRRTDLAATRAALEVLVLRYDDDARVDDLFALTPSARHPWLSEQLAARGRP